MANPKMKAESFEVIDIGEVKLKLIKINNLHIIPFDLENNPQDPEILKGNTFFSIFNHYFHHFVADTVFQYEYLKKFVPDLNIEFIVPYTFPYWRSHKTQKEKEYYFNYLKENHFGADTKNINLNIEQHKYFEDIVKIYDKNNNKKIYAKNSDYLIIESAYFLVDDFYFYTKDLLKELGLTGNEIPWLSDEWESSSMGKLFQEWQKDSWELLAARETNKLFTSIAEENATLPKKFYISRQKTNKRYEIELNLPKDKSVNRPDQAWQNYSQRYYSEEEHIENYFNELGYKSVTLEGMNFIDQINLFYNATHIAGLTGSGFINIVSCNKNVKIIEILALKDFPFRYSKFVEALGLKEVLIDLRNIEKEKRVILDKLKEYENEL